MLLRRPVFNVPVLKNAWHVKNVPHNVTHRPLETRTLPTANPTMNANAATARSIFLDAVENHAANDWDAYLNDACAGNAELRCRVADLLSAHAEGNRLLDAPCSAILSTSDVSI